MKMRKGLYRHKGSGDLFAIEFDEGGEVLSTSGPLLTSDLDPEKLDYDNYFRTEIRGRIEEFERLTKADYLEVLAKNGFSIKHMQRWLWD